MYDMDVLMSRRRKYGGYHPNFSSLWADYRGYGGYGSMYSGYFEPSPYIGYGIEMTNSIEEATRLHVEAQKNFEKAKEGYEEAKKKLQDCEKKVKDAEVKLNWAKGMGRYNQAAEQDKALRMQSESSTEVQKPNYYICG